MPDHDLELRATFFADRLVERHLAGMANIEEFLEFDIDAHSACAVLLERRAAARFPIDGEIVVRCRAADELYRQLRLRALQSEESTFGKR
jgi:hypothetical protein